MVSKNVPKKLSSENDHKTNLLIVVFPQLLQLLTLIMFDAVKHRINLSRLCLRLIIAIAQ